MTVVLHDEVPFHEVPRIKTRVLVDPGLGARESTLWEQWIEPTGFIPAHYHDTEEILVLLEGEVVLTLGDRSSVVAAPATVLVPAEMIHALRPNPQSRVHLLAFFPTVTPRIIALDGSYRPMPWEDMDLSDPPP